MPASIVSVNLASPETVQTGPWTGSVQRTGIDKRPVTGPVRAAGVNLGSDIVCDVENHGGVDQAVYAYATEDAAHWAQLLHREVGVGAFGENLTTSGLDLTGAVVGELWAVGTAVLEVSVPRIPCRTFAGWWDVPDLVKRFTREGRPGTYLRIHTEGDLQVGDAVQIVHRPAHGVTIGETFRALTGDRSLAHRLLEAPELPEEAHRRARTWLATQAQ